MGHWDCADTFFCLLMEVFFLFLSEVLVWVPVNPKSSRYLIKQDDYVEGRI